MANGVNASEDTGFDVGAIVFTDAEDSTRQGVKDEYTFELKRELGIQKVLCGEHGGSVIKSRGDGLLMVFPTADDAARMVCEYRQQKLDNFLGDLGRSRVRTRIVAHFGRYTRDDMDVLGNDVTLTARLIDEEEPKPFRIWFTRDFYVALDTFRLPPTDSKIVLPNGYKKGIKIHELRPPGAMASDDHEELAEARRRRHEREHDEILRRKSDRVQEIHRVTMSLLLAVAVGVIAYLVAKNPFTTQADTPVPKGPVKPPSALNDPDRTVVLAPKNSGTKVSTPIGQSGEVTPADPASTFGSGEPQKGDDPPTEPVARHDLKRLPADPADVDEGILVGHICPLSGDAANETCPGPFGEFKFAPDDRDEWDKRPTCTTDHTQD